MVDSLLELITERGSQKFYKPIEVHSVTNAIHEIEVSIIFCRQVVYKLKGKELFPDRMNRNRLEAFHEI